MLILEDHDDDHIYFVKCVSFFKQNINKIKNCIQAVVVLCADTGIKYISSIEMIEVMCVMSRENALFSNSWYWLVLVAWCYVLLVVCCSAQTLSMHASYSGIISTKHTKIISYDGHTANKNDYILGMWAWVYTVKRTRGKYRGTYDYTSCVEETGSMHWCYLSMLIYTLVIIINLITSHLFIRIIESGMILWMHALRWRL